MPRLAGGAAPQPCFRRVAPFFLLVYILSTFGWFGRAEEPLWRLKAYHLHHHADPVASPTTAPILLSERDLLTDACALDATVAAFETKKRNAITPAMTQSIALSARNFSRVAAVANLTEPRHSAFREHDSGMPESKPSAEVRKRDAVATRYSAVGVINLGIFQAEVADAPMVAALADLDGVDDDDPTLPDLTDPGDESDRAFEVHIFLADFSGVFCLSAALYANRRDVGNVSAALAMWLPPSVSPACAMRLTPQVRRSVGLSLTEGDVLPEWPLSEDGRCHLDRGQRFAFAFTPSQAQARKPSFCAYETADGVATPPVPGTRRHVSCEVFLDVQLLTWYSAAWREAKADAVAVKVAAAVTEVAATTRAGAPPVLGRLLSPAQERTQLKPLFAFGNPENETDETVIPSSLPLPARSAAPLAATSGHMGGISRYKGTLWCTAATVGSGFWFSDSAECADVVKRRLSTNRADARSHLTFIRDCVALSVVALAVAILSAVLSARAVKTVRFSRRRARSSR